MYNIRLSGQRRERCPQREGAQPDCAETVSLILLTTMYRTDPLSLPGKAPRTTADRAADFSFAFQDTAGDVVGRERRRHLPPVSAGPFASMGASLRSSRRLWCNPPEGINCADPLLSGCRSKQLSHQA